RRAVAALATTDVPAPSRRRDGTAAALGQVARLGRAARRPVRLARAPLPGEYGSPGTVRDARRRPGPHPVAARRPRRRAACRPPRATGSPFFPPSYASPSRLRALAR